MHKKCRNIAPSLALAAVAFVAQGCAGNSTSLAHSVGRVVSIKNSTQYTYSVYKSDESGVSTNVLTSGSTVVFNQGWAEQSGMTIFLNPPKDSPEKERVIRLDAVNRGIQSSRLYLEYEITPEGMVPKELK